MCYPSPCPIQINLIANLDIGTLINVISHRFDWAGIRTRELPHEKPTFSRFGDYILSYKVKATSWMFLEQEYFPNPKASKQWDAQFIGHHIWIQIQKVFTNPHTIQSHASWRHSLIDHKQSKAVYPFVRSRPRLRCASALVMRPRSDSMSRLIAKWMQALAHHYSITKASTSAVLDTLN